jgi:hypothetical protein
MTQPLGNLDTDCTYNSAIADLVPLAPEPFASQPVGEGWKRVQPVAVAQMRASGVMDGSTRNRRTPVQGYNDHGKQRRKTGPARSLQ